MIFTREYGPNENLKSFSKAKRFIYICWKIILIKMIKLQTFVWKIGDFSGFVASILNTKTTKLK